jgi:hypothetical protein
MGLMGSRMPSLKVALPVTCVAVAAAFALPAGASAFGHQPPPPPTLYVGGNTVGLDSGCNSPGYNSAQAAVNAATEGSTVYLCGQLDQQVFVDKSITLTGAPGSGLTAAGTTFAGASSYPAAFTSDGLAVPQALLVVTGGNPNVNGLTIIGGSTNGGCANEEYGVLALAGSVSLSGDQVLNVADSSDALWGCQYGVAIEIGSQEWPTTDFGSWPATNFAAHAEITGTDVSGYQKNGITVDGPGSSADISGSTVIGGGTGGELDPVIAQNGIQISDGATALITGNRVENDTYTAAAGETEATGILVWGGDGSPLSKGVQIDGNVLSGNDVGVALYNVNATGSAQSPTPTGEVVLGNQISDNAITNVAGLNSSDTDLTTNVAYQAGIEDVGYGDLILANSISGAGYAPLGTYDYSVNPDAFTATGGTEAFARPIDAGYGYPTKDPVLVGNSYDGRPYN